MTMAAAPSASGDAEGGDGGRAVQPGSDDHPGSPHAVDDASRHDESDQQDQPAVGRVMERSRRWFPARQPETEDAEHETDGHPRGRPGECPRNPERRDRRRDQEERGREHHGAQRQARHPSPRQAPRGSGAVALHQDQRHQRQDDEQQREQQQEQRHGMGRAIPGPAWPLPVADHPAGGDGDRPADQRRGCHHSQLARYPPARPRRSEGHARRRSASPPPR